MPQEGFHYWGGIPDFFPPMSTGFRIYVLFLLVAVVVAMKKLLRVWMVAMPFRISRQAGNASYLRLFEKSRDSLKQWMGCILLGGAIVVSTDFASACSRWMQAKITGAAYLLYS